MIVNLLISLAKIQKLYRINKIFQKNLHNSKKNTIFARFFLRYGHATVAQLVEQRIRNAWVAGSSPASGSQIGTPEMGSYLAFIDIKTIKKPLAGETKKSHF